MAHREAASMLRGDEPVEAALAEYFARLDRGDSVDLSELVAAYPGCEKGLRQFLNQERNIYQAVTAVALTDADRGNLANRTFGDFRLSRLIGRGGMGVVWEAEQLSLARKVAVKLLPGGLCADPRHRTRFQNEAKILAQLEHPNIVHVIAVGVEADTYYFAMRLVDGITADDLIRAWGDQSRRAAAETPIGALSDTKADDPLLSASEPALAPTFAWVNACAISSERYCLSARIAADVAEGLAHAHACGVLHRDVKPSNILLDASGIPQLSDFGLARMYGDATLTATGAVLGTLRYASPEQLRGTSAAIDERSDVYSLGVTLWELVTGQRLTPAEDHNSAINHVLNVEAPRPSSLVAQVPRDLETIIACALAKDPGDRYGSAQAFADDLRAFLEDRPIQAKPATLSQRAARWSRRHRPIVWATAVALLVCTLFAGGSIGWTIRDEQTRQAAAETKILAALELAKGAYDDGNIPNAAAAVRQAEGLVAISAMDSGVQYRVRQWQSALATVHRLEEIQLEKTALSKDGDFDFTELPGKYAEAFRDFGIELDGGNIQHIAARIRQSPIQGHLVAAVDESATIREGEERSRLLDVARAADSDPWRNSMRDAIENNDIAALTTLARDDACLKQTPTIIVSVANHLIEGGEMTLGIETLQNARRSHPNDFWINRTLGDHLLQSSPGEAAEFYRIALSIRRDSNSTRNILGVALALAGNEAVAEAESLALMRRRPALLLSNISWELAQDEEFVEAENTARRAIRYDPDRALAHTSLGKSLEGQGRLEDAMEAYREVIRLEPNKYSAYLSMADCFVKLGKLEEAAAVLKDLIGFESRVPQFRRELGIVLLQMGNQEEAEEAFQQADRLATMVHAQTGRNLPGDAFAYLGEFQKAGELYLLEAEKNPYSGDIAMRTAFLLLAIGDRDRYEAICRTMLTRFGATTEPSQARQVCCACMITPQIVGEIDELLRLSDIALTSPKNLAVPYRERGLAALRAGDWEGTLHWCAKSRELNPTGHYVAQNHILEAIAYHHLGKTGEAMAAYKGAAKLIRRHYPRAPIRITGGEWIEWLSYEFTRREAAALLGIED